MKPSQTCPITGKSLEGFHGNRKVHPEAERTRKNHNNKKRYSKLKEMDKLALGLDKTLEYYYPFSNGTVAIDRNLLKGFFWDFTTKMTKGTTEPIIWVLNYGYSFIDNKKKIIIHYGNKHL
jgi:hypothetical protein